MFKAKKIIFGIDPGYGRCGFGVVSCSGTEVRMLLCGVISTSARGTQSERLLELAKDLRLLLKKTKPDVVAVEKLFFTTNAKTAMRVAEARGVVLLACAEAGVSLVELTPNQVKAAVTGTGRAGKGEVGKMVVRLLGLSRVPKPDDAADALAIAIAGIGM